MMRGGKQECSGGMQESGGGRQEEGGKNLRRARVAQKSKKNREAGVARRVLTRPSGGVCESRSRSSQGTERAPVDRMVKVEVESSSARP